jgi:septal ring factor EnvC (AmiA/AmiB activator)
MLKINIDLKAIIILSLAVALVLSLIFRPSVPIDEYEEEISVLQKQNEKLIISNDSIVKANIKLQKEIEVILYAIDSTKVVLRETENKLEELERKRNEVSNIVDNMDSDGVTNTLSDYLQRRGQNNR